MTQKEWIEQELKKAVGKTLTIEFKGMDGKMEEYSGVFNSYSQDANSSQLFCFLANNVSFQTQFGAVCKISYA